MNESKPQPGGDDFAEQLASMRPAASRLDRERLMFQAGIERARAEGGSAATTHWLWPLSTAVACLAAATFAWRLYQLETPFADLPPAAVRQLAREPAPADDRQPPAMADAPLPRVHYLDLRRLALTDGVDTLAGPLTGAGQAADRSLRFHELRKLRWRLDGDPFDPLQDLRRETTTVPQGENS